MSEDSGLDLSTGTNDKLLNFLHLIITFTLRILAILVTIMIFWGVMDVCYMLYEQAIHSFIGTENIDSMFHLFAAFLAVLIGIEIFMNIALYLRERVIHVRLVLTTALIAVSRKVIVIDYDKFSWEMTFAIGALVLALGLVYWLTTKESMIRLKKEDHA